MAALNRTTLVFITLLFSVTGCASQFAESFVGKDVVYIELENGRPHNIVKLPDGRRSYQYFWGGGTFVAPQTTTGTVNVIGNTGYINTRTSPATVVSSKGCLINFIAEQQGSRWIVVKATWPSRMFC